MQNQELKTEVSQHELEIIAKHIERLTKATEALRTSRLKEKTILILLKDMTGMAQRDIKIVLDALPLLAKEYLKPEPPSKPMKL